MVVFDYGKVNRIFSSEINEELAQIMKLQSDKIYIYKTLVEKEYGMRSGLPSISLVDSGTTALHLALKLCDIGKGDRVAIPACNYASAPLAILHAGAIPVPVDIKTDCTIDPELIPQDVKAILAVHMFGQVCDMDSLQRIGIPVIEDACQAHGCLYNGKPVGALGTIGALSFSHHKAVGAYGGGAIITKAPADLSRYLQIEQDSSKLLVTHRVPAKMSFADMAILRVKLKHYDELMKDKLRSSASYDRLLNDVAQVETIPSDGNQSIKQMYVLYCKDRDGLHTYLRRQGMESILPFKAMNELRMYRQFCTKLLPNTERYSNEALFLPMHSFIEDKEVKAVCQHIRHYYSR